MTSPSERFDRRIVPDTVVELLLACQRLVPCRLAGGAALAGAYLRHRLSNDLDLFVPGASDVLALERGIESIAAGLNAGFQLVQQSPTFVRLTIALPERALAIDLVHEPAAAIEPPVLVEGVLTESLADLRASKLTCILSRSEPRDLVDLLFLDRAGYPPEQDLALAVRKDGGVDPGVLAWLLHEFPVEPMPSLLLPLSVEELTTFRAMLKERMRLAAVPE
ncbi:MAG: nucleotidyl transferase AbiEii/AbiGii toxin family protein, partial [Polyangia bacterium]|nr:nucleotidyl transferase AbiEii/AbiGii toxin family protein [Polyangia bacterium]